MVVDFEFVWFKSIILLSLQNLLILRVDNTCSIYLAAQITCYGV